MRGICTGIMMAAAAWPVGAQPAGGKESPARGVHVIAMGGPAQQQTEPGSDMPGQPHAPGQMVRHEAGFRVHDLSRRWVEFQMLRDFIAEPEQVGDVPGNSGTVVLAGLPALIYGGSQASAASSVRVPLWMQGHTSAGSRYIPQCSAAPYRPAGFLRSDAEYRRAGFYDLMSKIACEFEIPVGLFDAMIIRESRYQAGVFSSKNAFGLTQLMPGTAAELGVDRYRVEDNLRGGARYLRQQLDRFGHYHLALAAYNAGPGRVRNGRVPQIAETQAYVENILANWSRLNGIMGTARVPPRASESAPGRMASVSTF